MIAAVVLDLDGVLIDSESIWASAREEVTTARGGRWDAGAARDMMGMSSPEWSRYLNEELGVAGPPDEIVAAVVARMDSLYREQLPLLPGAQAAAERLAGRWPLGLASSANRPLIDLVLELAAIGDHFQATVSSEEVARGKPAPDVYLEAARRLKADPRQCLAVEDSTNGIRAALSAEMAVVALPNADFPPEPEALALADTVLAGLDQLVPDVLEPLGRGALARRRTRRRAGAPERPRPISGNSPLGEALSFGPLPGPGDSDGG